MEIDSIMFKREGRFVKLLRYDMKPNHMAYIVRGYVTANVEELRIGRTFISSPYQMQK